MLETTLYLGELVIRDLRLDDAEPMTVLAANPNVARTLRDLFPQPYKLQDARDFIAGSATGQAGQNFAITRQQEFLGVIGYWPGQDVYRNSAEIGFWLGEPFWGHGLMTTVVAGFAEHLLANLGFRRVFAGVFSSNPGSARVLEKAGFTREGVMRNHVHKNGEILDEWVYARLRADD